MSRAALVAVAICLAAAGLEALCAGYGRPVLIVLGLPVRVDRTTAELWASVVGYLGRAVWWSHRLWRLNDALSWS